MKHIKPFVLFLLLIAVTVSCDDNVITEKNENLPLERITKTTLAQENHLEYVLNFSGFNNTPSNSIENGRVNSAGFEIETESILKVLQDDDVHHAYTFKIMDDSIDNSFSNLVIQEIENGYLGYVLQYVSTEEYMDILRFTGTLKRFDLDGALLDEKYFENGGLTSSGTNNGRAASGDCLEMSITEECTRWDYIHNYQNTQTTGFGCVEYDILIRFTATDCGISGGGSGGDGGGTYIPPAFPDAPSGPGGINTGGGSSTGNPSNNTGGTTVGIMPEGGGDVKPPKLTIVEKIEILLEDNPFALVEIPCDQLPKWQTLAQNKASQTIKDKINALDQNAGWFSDWAIQTLNGANGTIVNMDYFSVNVTTLPNNPSTNQPFTAESFLDYFRRNINDFAEGSTFSPYCETPAICVQETTLWNSNDPTGAIVYIDIPGDDGVVVCSEYTSSYWYFMTLEAPGAGNHPVSGTRQFGFEANANGGYNFYVRGVDRFDSNIMENTAYATFVGNPFKAADNLWVSFQHKLNQYVNNNGGESNTNAPVKYRPDWDMVKDVLEGKKPISDLGCN